MIRPSERSRVVRSRVVRSRVVRSRVGLVLALTCLVGCERERVVPQPELARDDREVSRDDDRPGLARRVSELPDIPCPHVRVVSAVAFLFLEPLFPESITAMAVEYRPNRLVWLLDAMFVDHPRDNGGQCRFELRFTL